MRAGIATLLMPLLLASLAGRAAAEQPSLRNEPRLADRLLSPAYSWDIVGARVSVSRGALLLNDSLVASGLAGQLLPSTRASALAGRAHRELTLGHTLYYAGLRGILAGVVCVAAGAAQVTRTAGAQVALGTTGGIVALAGVVSAIFGAVCIHAGLGHVLDAVTAYNFELVANVGVVPGP